MPTRSVLESSVPLGESEPQTITLSEPAWQQFMAALDDPPEPNEELKKLMKEFGPWKDGARPKK